jgi:hypothetical protein
MMKTNSFFLLLLKIYAVSWILVGMLGLFVGLPNLLQGKFEIPYMILALPVGIGLFRQSRSARRDALIFLFVFLAFDVFLFLMAGTSGKFSESAITIKGIGESETEVPNTIFYPLSLGLLAGQIWFLMSKQITQYFLAKDNESS